MIIISSVTYLHFYSHNLACSRFISLLFRTFNCTYCTRVTINLDYGSTLAEEKKTPHSAFDNLYPNLPESKLLDRFFFLSDSQIKFLSAFQCY